MKLLKFNVLVILALLISVNVIARESFERKISKIFDLSENSKFEIKNKFGEINIVDWDKSQISIDVRIKVEAKNAKKAEDIFKKINIEIKEKGDIISAITDLDGSIGNGDFSIDYLIRMPKDLSIDLSNKFGTVIINELTGDAKLKIEYSTLQLEYSENLKVISRFSTAKIGNVKDLIVDSKYDTYKCGRIKHLTMSGKFSSAKIGLVISSMNLDSQYGNFELNNVEDEFEFLNINNKYGDVEITINSKISYILDVKVDYCGLDYPDSNSVEFIKDNSHKEAKGLIGNDKSTKSRINITSKYGSIELN